MSYSQLRAFHNVALYGGFSRAAEKIALTQPALSEHVRRLEQDHDVLLFRREKKRVFLTDSGTRLFALTRQLFEVEQHIDDFLLENRSEIKGELRLIVDSATHISAFLVQFKTQYPDIFVSIKTSNTEDMVSELRAYNAEVAVGGRVEKSGDLKQLTLGSSALVAIAAKHYIPTTIKNLKFSQITSYPLVFREQGSKTRELIEQEAKRRNMSLSSVMEVEGREALRDIVASGAGIGFVSEAEFGNDNRLRRIPLSDCDLQMQESLVYLAQRGNLAIINRFVEFVAESLESS